MDYFRRIRAVVNTIFIHYLLFGISVDPMCDGGSVVRAYYAYDRHLLVRLAIFCI